MHTATSHVVWPVTNSVSGLQLANVADYGSDIRLAHLWLRRHVTKRPMMLPHAPLGREYERVVCMMAGIVDVMHQRRPLVRSGGVSTVALSAGRVERRLADLRRLRQRGHLHRNDCVCPFR